MRIARTHAYVASPELQAIWSNHARDKAAWLETVRAAPRPPGDLTYALRSDWTGYENHISGFLPTESNASIPAGLRRASPRRALLVPYKDKRGDEWRTLLRQLPTPPKVAGVLQNTFGIRDSTVDSGRGDLSSYMIWPLFEEFPPDPRMFVTTADKHPETPHLTAIPLSEYHRAREANANV